MDQSHLRGRGSALQQGFIVLGVVLFGAYLLYDRGFLSIIVEGDKSRLSWLIIAIWALLSARWLYLLYWLQKQNDDLSVLRQRPESERETMMARWLNHGWVASDSVLKIGLLGTIIGFILMLSPIASLTGFDPGSLQKALAEMSGGMAVALYTTLSGLIGNILLRLQYQFLADEMQKTLLAAYGDTADTAA
ncbi:MAG: MotA/TolQ/ExbB proton channel family protein [Parvibaculales bacterium]